jgi:beta-lysine 5,6-aminomutase alpha subunit
MARISLDMDKVKNVRRLAEQIALEVQKFVDQHSSVSVERAILRLYGVDGVDSNGTPLPNRVVDIFHEKKLLEKGVSPIFAAAMLESNRNALDTAVLIVEEKINLEKISTFAPVKIKEKEKDLCKHAISILDNTRRKKEQKQQKFPLPPTPWKYLIVATGNIYEDRTQAKSAVDSGADIIAVIRSTAQSLLDYVPYGATTEGFGGTYATQENFKIMRKALDEAAEDAKRYIRLVNYSSGLCMAEIAACAAIEDLDMLLNDSMYGILFRDINVQRTLIDQYFSRLICSRSKIIINTGEDNYLTTSDAIENAYTVTASQLINEAMGKKALLTDDLLGLGHAFEINPEVENGFLYELAHAQLARELFPKAPLKYMPPTKYKSTDIFYSHCMDAMFNLASITTNQGIHLAGILTEAIHTPLMQDRTKALKNINYIFNTTKDLSDEIEFKKGGFIEKRAQTVLDEVEKFLIELNDIGLMKAISLGKFANVKRAVDGGKGLDGVFKKSFDYSNPIMDLIEKEGVIHE